MIPAPVQPAHILPAISTLSSEPHCPPISGIDRRCPINCLWRPQRPLHKIHPTSSPSCAGKQLEGIQHNLLDEPTTQRISYPRSRKAAVLNEIGDPDSCLLLSPSLPPYLRISARVISTSRSFLSPSRNGFSQHRRLCSGSNQPPLTHHPGSSLSGQAPPFSSFDNPIM